MSSEFERCIEKAKIVAFQKGPSLVSKELNSATEDLLSSKESFDRGNHKWATIQAYYSMFHTSRGLIYNKKYREKSHYCLVIAHCQEIAEKVSPFSKIDLMNKGLRVIKKPLFQSYVGCLRKEAITCQTLNCELLLNAKEI